MKNVFIAFSMIMAAGGAAAQSVGFDTDALQRGYYDRPYLRYEAEAGKCVPEGGVFILASPYSQDQLASEASGLQALSLGSRGDGVGWTLDADANALTVRFSLPDSPDGSGTRQDIGIYDGDTRVATLTLDSYWAWQYTPKANVSEKYPDNTPASSKFARMRFDEASILLPVTIAKGHTLRLVKDSDSADSLAIDFIEAEMAAPALTFDEIEAADKVEYTGNGSNLAGFIAARKGKTIFIPAGVYNVPEMIVIGGDGTRIVGAGMWHTTLNFTASSDKKSTYYDRGIKCNSDNCGLSGVSLVTVNNKRYFENNPSKQVGKGLMGSWGRNAVVENVRIDHFECGAWIADYDGNASRNLRVTHCRFRNNYADGINLCSGTEGAVVSHCSFRNNGDDDQALWSTGQWSRDNEYAYNTAENNWRASSLGFFGGEGNRAHHIAIFDAMECGARINGTFQGTGFGAEESSFEEISIYRSGCSKATTGVQGDFWGNPNPALWIMGGYFYEVKNVSLSHIDIYDSRFEGVRVQSDSGRAVSGLTMTCIHVDGVSDSGRAFNFYPGLKGSGTGIGLSYENCDNPEPISAVPGTFDFTYTVGIEPAPATRQPDVRPVDGGVFVSLADADARATVYDARGFVAGSVTSGMQLLRLSPGFYIVTVAGMRPVKVVVR